MGPRNIAIELSEPIGAKPIEWLKFIPGWGEGHSKLPTWLLV